MRRKTENISIEIHHTLRLLIIYLLHALINRKNKVRAQNPFSEHKKGQYTQGPVLSMYMLNSLF